MTSLAAKEQDHIPVSFQRHIRHFGDIGDQPDAADRRGSAGSPRRWSRCRARHCRTRPGSPAPCRPRHALDGADELAHDLGRSGLPKFRQSVMASGLAPTAVRLRQASATACLPPSNGSAPTVARGDVAGDREALVGAVDADDAGIAAGPLHGVGHDHVVVLFPDPAARDRCGRADQRSAARQDACRRGTSSGADRGSGSRVDPGRS